LEKRDKGTKDKEFPKKRDLLSPMEHLKVKTNN